MMAQYPDVFIMCTIVTNFLLCRPTTNNKYVWNGVYKMEYMNGELITQDEVLYTKWNVIYRME